MTVDPLARRPAVRDDVIASYVRELATAAGWRSRDAAGPARVGGERTAAATRRRARCTGERPD